MLCINGLSCPLDKIANVYTIRHWHFIMGAAILVVIENLIGPHAITLRIDFRWQIQSFSSLLSQGLM